MTAIRATFADWRTVKTRKALQLIFEVSLEQQAEVLAILGAPMPDVDTWVAIARLKPDAGAITREALAKLNALMANEQALPHDAGEHPVDAKPGAEARQGDPQASLRDAEERPAVPDVPQTPTRQGEPSERSRQAKARYAAMTPQEQAVVRAARLPDDPRFQAWAWGYDPADYVRGVCRVKSRAEIATNPEAYRRFIEMETAYLAGTGQMAEPR